MCKPTYQTKGVTEMGSYAYESRYGSAHVLLTRHVGMRFYAYESRYGSEYKGDGYPHSFDSKADRDTWVAASGKRGTLRRREFEKKAREFLGYVNHARGDFEGAFHPVYL